MRSCDITDCLLLHRELQILVQLGKCFLRKRLHEKRFKLLSVQAGERRDIVQRMNDGLSRLLRFRKKLHIHILCPDAGQQQIQGHARLVQPRNRSVGDIQYRAANRAGRHDASCIGYGILPEIQR